MAIELVRGPVYTITCDRCGESWTDIGPKPHHTVQRSITEVDSGFLSTLYTCVVNVILCDTCAQEYVRYWDRRRA